MDDFDSFITRAWDDHAADPAGVAVRLQTAAPALVADEDQLVRLAQLSHHVWGEHLGQWPAGIAAQEALAALPACGTAGPAAQALRRCIASLQLSSGAGPDALAGLGPSDRIRATAMAAANLCERDTARAARLLQQALADADAAALPASDPAHRGLAVSSHNLACTLEAMNGRSAEERAWMITAAQASRHHWQRAGSWLEVERAEYRLASTWLQAGDAAQARRHAEACLAIVSAHGGPALERYFGWEVLGRAERALGGAAAFEQALAQATAAFAELGAADRDACRASLDALAATLPST